MKERTCWTKMISSINFFHKKDNKSKGPTQTSKNQSKFEQSAGKQSKKVPGKENNSIKSQSINQASKDSTAKQELGQTPHFNKLSKKSQNEENHIRQVQQEPGETQRNFIQSEVQSSNPGQSDQNSLPTEKSQIIMNDIGKDIDHNENNFLFDQNYEQVGNFSEVYEKIKLVKTSVIYEEYLVKKKTTGQIRKAYLMRPYETFIQDWNIEQEEAIEKYSDLYEREKHHIKSLITLARNNCRHLVKLLDYQLKPPTINTNESNKFVPGSIAVVFQTTDFTLPEYLIRENESLSRLDKKKLIFEICTCLNDIHQKALSAKDLTFQSFGLDKFGNIKFNSLAIQDFDAKFYHSEDVKNKLNLLYSTPQELETQVKSNRSAENKTFFHSGFSQISDFDKTQSTPEQQNLWKLGIIFVKILTGKFIFNEQSAKEQKDQIREILEIKQNTVEARSILREKLSNLSLNEIKTIESLLKIKPNDRMSCKQLLVSEYLTNILEDSCEQN